MQVCQKFCWLPSSLVPQSANQQDKGWSRWRCCHWGLTHMGGTFEEPSTRSPSLHHMLVFDRRTSSRSVSASNLERQQSPTTTSSLVHLRNTRPNTCNHQRRHSCIHPGFLFYCSLGNANYSEMDGWTDYALGSWLIGLRGLPGVSSTSISLSLFHIHYSVTNNRTVPSTFPSTPRPHILPHCSVVLAIWKSPAL